MAFGTNADGTSKVKNEEAIVAIDGMKLLVAEDSNLNMTITRKFLQRWNVDIREARTVRKR